MNRHERRAATARLRAMPSLAGPMQGVALVGGPMDGWVVKPDAPALRPDWHTTLPPRPRSFLSRMSGQLASSAPGRYVLDTSQRATWQPIGEG